MPETKVIWKIPLPDLDVKPNVEVQMPPGEILTVAMQGDLICVWLEVFLNDGKPSLFPNEPSTRRFSIHRTGDTIPLDRRQYVGTVHTTHNQGMPLVLHLYELLYR